LFDFVPSTRRAACGAAKRIFIRNDAQVLGRSDQPPEWLTAYQLIPVSKENP
jgi:hypothetical protein